MDGSRKPWVILGLGAVAIIAIAAIGVVLVAGGGGDQSKSQTAPARPPAPQRIRVPSVVDGSLERARRSLRELGLATQLRRRRYSDKEKGTVLSQSPDPGREVAPGTVVKLTVSRGPAPPKEPYGPLGTSSIGAAKVGMSPDEVSRFFVAPDRKQDVNFGGGSAPQVDWIYDVSGGTLRLQFDVTEGHNELTGYTTDSASFSTVSGYKVGSSMPEVEKRYGDQLTTPGFGIPCGPPSGSCLLPEGDSGYPGITFSYSDDVISDISGGNQQAAGE